MKKTNAVRELDKHKIKYNLKQYNLRRFNKIVNNELKKKYGNNISAHTLRGIHAYYMYKFRNHDNLCLITYV
ncbi:MAG: hypothetical protein ACPGDB_03395, partial [Fusobacterium sp.]